MILETWRLCEMTKKIFTICVESYYLIFTHLQARVYSNKLSIFTMTYKQLDLATSLKGFALTLVVNLHDFVFIYIIYAASHQQTHRIHRKIAFAIRDSIINRRSERITFK